MRQIWIIVTMSLCVACTDNHTATRREAGQNPLSAERYEQWRRALSNDYDLHLPADPMAAYIHSIAIFVEILTIRLDVTPEQTTWLFAANTNVPEYGQLRFDEKTARDLVTYGYDSAWWMTQVNARAVYGTRRGTRVTPAHTWRYTVYVAAEHIADMTNRIYICRTEEL